MRMQCGHGLCGQFTIWFELYQFDLLLKAADTFVNALGNWRKQEDFGCPSSAIFDEAASKTRVNGTTNLLRFNRNDRFSGYSHARNRRWSVAACYLRRNGPYLSRHNRIRSGTTMYACARYWER